ncbi:unnamed protein product [Peniophora sp. CBMAI 1063]|nr:unnamed protein product [Peniophora sp. CBMAI 1063]
MAPSVEDLVEERARHHDILKLAYKHARQGYQPSRETWEMTSKAVVAGTLSSLSDIALAVYGSTASTPVHSEESFVDDGSGPNRHIPSCVRHPLTPPSVLAVIGEVLPDIDIDAPACHAAAANLYGLWHCPAVDCSHIVDVTHIRAGDLEFLLQHAAGKAATLVAPSGIGRITAGDPSNARAALQLLVYRHFERGHLSRRGLEMIVSPTVRLLDGQHTVTWRYKSDWVELMPDLQSASADDERRVTQMLRQWLSDKGSRVCDRLRRPNWVKYRLWARRDRAERQQTVRAALEAGHSDYEAAFELFRHIRLGNARDDDSEVFQAYVRAEGLDRDVLNFMMLPVRPWPREYPAWASLSEAEREEIMNVYASADHEAQLKCERRIYNYPFLVDW